MRFSTSKTIEIELSTMKRILSGKDKEGMRRLIFIVSTQEITPEDNEYFNEVGLKIYTVAAKFNDFTFGPETHEIQVFKAISSPLDMIATPADLYGKTNLKSTPNPTNSTNMIQAPLALDISDLVPTPNSWITDF